VKVKVTGPKSVAVWPVSGWSAVDWKAVLYA